MARDPGVVAVQRRSMYQRVLERITFYEGWARTDLGLTDDEQRQLERLREWRDELRREMQEAGQIV